MLVALGSYFSDSLEGIKLDRKKIVCILSIVAIVFGVNSLKGVRYNAFATRVINTHFEQAGQWLEENVPEGELIFHANWSDSQYFIGLNPKNDYFVTLDPVYMYKWDPGLYTLYRDVAFGRTEDPYPVLKDNFNIKYGYISRSYFSALIDQIQPDDRFSILAEDDFGVIFKLK
jgi:hypothetical protein